jgi:hypothetical protein
MILIFYFVVNTLGSGFYHALQQFKALWGYIITIATGFGIQIALYTHIREFNITCRREVAVSGSMSAGSMVACCIHHVTDFIPLIGSGFAFFLSAYAELFLIVGVLSNVIGITFMLATMQKSGIYTNDGPFSRLFGSVDFSKIRYLVLIASISFIAYYYLTYHRPEVGGLLGG